MIYHKKRKDTPNTNALAFRRGYTAAVFICSKIIKINNVLS